MTSMKITVEEEGVDESAPKLMINRAGAVVLITLNGDQVLLVSASVEQKAPCIANDIRLDHYRIFHGSIEIITD